MLSGMLLDISADTDRTKLDTLAKGLASQACFNLVTGTNEL